METASACCVTAYLRVRCAMGFLKGSAKRLHGECPANAKGGHGRAAGRDFTMRAQAPDPGQAVERSTVSTLARRIAASLTRERDLLAQGCLRVTGAAVRDRAHHEARWAASGTSR
jgi:hypothetical protein